MEGIDVEIYIRNQSKHREWRHSSLEWWVRINHLIKWIIRNERYLIPQAVWCLLRSPNSEPPNFTFAPWSFVELFLSPPRSESSMRLEFPLWRIGNLHHNITLKLDIRTKNMRLSSLAITFAAEHSTPVRNTSNLTISILPPNGTGKVSDKSIKGAPSRLSWLRKCFVWCRTESLPWRVISIGKRAKLSRVNVNICFCNACHAMRVGVSCVLFASASFTSSSSFWVIILSSFSLLCRRLRPSGIHNIIPIKAKKTMLRALRYSSPDRGSQSWPGLGKSLLVYLRYGIVFNPDDDNAKLRCNTEQQGMEL